MKLVKKRWIVLLIAGAFLISAKNILPEDIHKGFDPSQMDLSVSPTVDFYDYAVGHGSKKRKYLMTKLPGVFLMNFKKNLTKTLEQY